MPSSNKARRCCLHNPLEPVGECSCACHRAALSARPTGDTLPAAVLDNMADAFLRPTGDTALLRTAALEFMESLLREQREHQRRLTTAEVRLVEAVRADALAALSSPATPPALDVEALRSAYFVLSGYHMAHSGHEVGRPTRGCPVCESLAAIKGDAS